MLNPFFTQGTSGEQSLIQDLINEQLTINTTNCDDIINLNYFVIYLHETNKIPNKAKKYLLFNTEK